MRTISLAVTGALALSACSCSAPPARFDTAGQAVETLVAALRTDDHATLVEIVGEANEDIIGSGDEVSDRADRRDFLALYDEEHRFEELPDGSLVLCVGETDWPMPIPLVESDGSWSFDAESGREELIARRVGRNELDTVQVCLAIVDAQHDYYAADRDGDNILEYARRFGSTAGQRDGLYWPTAEGEPASPLGALVAEANAEGYRRRGAEGSTPFHGYLYRILEGQGPGARGGAYDYVVRDDMIGGFAVIAHPAEYGSSGVTTFIVNHDGTVFEKDLGSGTAKAAARIDRFDPAGWSEVDVAPRAAENGAADPGKVTP